MREEILKSCFEYLDSKMNVLSKAIQDAETSIREDTKSSAGDKYETSREMIQQDLNRYQQQKKVLLQDQEVLHRIASHKDINQSASLGSIIETHQAIYFLAISIGKLTLPSGNTLFVISPQSPIGQILLGKKAMETFSFQSQEQKILKIF